MCRILKDDSIPVKVPKADKAEFTKLCYKNHTDPSKVLRDAMYEAIEKFKSKESQK
jgi:hypothetical protein